MKAFRLCLWVMVLTFSAYAGQDVRVFSCEDLQGNITPGSIEKAFKDEGFVIGANNDMTHPFRRDFGTSHMDVYNLMVVYRKDTIYALAENYPEFGLFTPLSMSIYKSKGQKRINVALLRTELMADMMGVPRDHPAIKALNKHIEDALRRAMPLGVFMPLSYTSKKPQQEVITRYRFTLSGEDIEEAKDNFEEEFEEAMGAEGFVMASFTDIGYELDERHMNMYDFYDVYSICKIPVIYEVSKLHPEAGAFAPCSAYLYKRKGEAVVHMAFPNVYKWIASLDITDKPSLTVLSDAQKRFEKVLQSMQKKYALDSIEVGKKDTTR